MQETYFLRFRDRTLLAAAAILVSLPALLVDHAATPGEAALAQSLREMAATDQWLIPTVGGLPWLETPPLVQWFAHAATVAFGITDVLTGIRLAGMIPLVLSTIWTATFAAASSGRRSGVLAGFILLTTLGIAESTWHGGTVIWIIAAACGMMNLLARLESYSHARRQSSRPIGVVDVLRREHVPGVLAVFVLLGLSTMIAGSLAAVTTILLPAAGHVFWRRGAGLRISNPWHTGWLITAAIAAAWPLTARLLLSSTSTHWLDTIQANSVAGWQPTAQLRQLVSQGLPWMPLSIMGLWCIRHDALAGSYSRERLLVCWSLVVPAAVFLLTPSAMPLGLAAAGAWSVSAAIGVDRLTRLVFRELPMLETSHNRAILQKFLAASAAILTLPLVWHDSGDDFRQTHASVLQEARNAARDGHPIFIDMNMGEPAATLLFELGDLATPLPSPHTSMLNLDSLIISTDALHPLRGSRNSVVAHHHDSGLRLVIFELKNTRQSQTSQIASLPSSTAY